MPEVKASALIEGTLRVGSLFAALIPQVMGLALFAFSVGPLALVTGLVAAIALAVLVFLPRFRCAWWIAPGAASILAAEAAWEIFDTLKHADEIAFSSVANFSVGLLWLAFLIVKRIGARGSGSSRYVG